MDLENPKSPTEKDIVAKVFHTDAEVQSLKRETASIASSLSRIENYIINKPPVNMIGIISIGVTVVSLIAASLFAMTQYVNMVNAPLRMEIDQQTQKIEELQEFKGDVNYEMGIIHEWKQNRQAKERGQ